MEMEWPIVLQELIIKINYPHWVGAPQMCIEELSFYFPSGYPNICKEHTVKEKYLFLKLNKKFAKEKLNTLPSLPPKKQTKSKQKNT